MIGYFKAVYDWLSQIGGELLGGLYDVIRRYKWFFVAFLGAVLAPIVWVLQIAKDLTAGLVDTSAEVLQLMTELDLNAAGGMWAALGDGAALMNCVVPLDYCLTVFGTLLSLWLVIMAIKGAIWIYRLIPNIAGFGPGG